MKTSSFSKYWPWFFFAAAFESLFALIVLLSIPSEGGLSMARLALAAVLLLFLGVGIILGLRRPTGLDKIVQPAFIIAAALLSLTSGLILFFLRYLDPEQLLPICERLSPLLWYFALLGIQSALFLLLLRNGFNAGEFIKRKPIYWSSLFAFVALLFVFIFAALTKLGITKDSAYWGEPGVALLGWQTALALIVGFSFLIYALRIMHPGSSRLLKFILPLSIWLTAVLLWLSVPVDVLQNSFYAPITPPANTPFPYSDAGYYDYLSQSLLIGTDYLGGIPPRPLYVLFLAALHALFGQDYTRIIAAQTFLLALFPVTLYFLGKKLHTPAAGVTVAVLAIFRELTSLWISSNTRVVNSKIFTTDFPTALGIAVVCLVAIHWLEHRDAKSTLFAGGAFGLLLLLRSQSLIILPILFMLAWFAYQRRTRQWLTSTLVFVLALVVTLAPWLIHNYTVTGKLAFDDPKQMAVIYSQYSFTGNLDISRFDIQTSSLGQSLFQFAMQNPAFVAGFITNHFLNTEIGGLLALPLIERFDGLFAPVNLYWITWDGTLTWYNLLFVFLYLVVIAIGLGSAWHRLRWIGLVPLAFNLGYALSNGIARFSSWRYNLPIDWVAYFYFGIGAMEILGGLALLFGAKVQNLFSNVGRTEEIKTWTLRQIPVRASMILIALVFVGSLPWLAKGFVLPRYTSTHDELIGRLSRYAQDSVQVETFLSLPNTMLFEGRLLYPRFYRRNLGLSATNPWPAYAVRDFSRLGFVLLNDADNQAVFPSRELLAFPHGADAVVLGCRRQEYLDVRLIVFTETDTVYSSAPLTDPCD